LKVFKVQAGLFYYVCLCGRNGAAEGMIDELIKIGKYRWMEINL